MFNIIKKFIQDWKNESKSTTKVLNALINESLPKKVDEEGRDLRSIEWHTVRILAIMPGCAGLKVEAPFENASESATAAEILSTNKSAFKKVADSLFGQIKANWSKTSLPEIVKIWIQMI